MFPAGRPEETVDRNGYVFCVLDLFTGGSDEDVARLSPYMHAHINVHSHYAFAPLDLGAGIGNGRCAIP